MKSGTLLLFEILFLSIMIMYKKKKCMLRLLFYDDGGCDDLRNFGITRFHEMCITQPLISVTCFCAKFPAVIRI